MAGECYHCVKYLLFAFNFLVWLFGCAILGVGIWIRVDPSIASYVDASDRFDNVYIGAYIFIVVGSIIMIIGFLGCCGAIRESQCLLALFFMTLFIIFALLVAAGIWAIVFKDSLKDFLVTSLNDAVKDYDSDDKSKLLMNKLQRGFHCCGSGKGPDDYGLSVAGRASCKENESPCGDKVFEYVREHLIIIAGIAIGIGVILIFGMMMTCYLCCAVRRFNDAKYA